MKRSEPIVTRVMREHAWSIAEESIARLPSGAWSIGIGDDAVSSSGFSAEQIVASLGPLLNSLVDGGANVAEMDGSLFYIHRRGKAVDVGSRADFVALGWGDICDVCDEGMRGPGETPAT